MADTEKRSVSTRVKVIIIAVFFLLGLALGIMAGYLKGGDGSRSLRLWTRPDVFLTSDEYTIGRYARDNGLTELPEERMGGILVFVSSDGEKLHISDESSLPFGLKLIEVEYTGRYISDEQAEN